MSSSRPRSVHRSAVAGSVAARWSSPVPSSPGPAATARLPSASSSPSVLVRASGASTSLRGGPSGCARLGVDTGARPRPRHPDAALDRALEAEIAAELGGGAAALGLAADAWSALGWPYHEAWARLRRAEAGFTARDRETARASLDEAIRIADLLGAGTLRDRAEDLARRSRVVARPARRVAPDPSELTSREREVLGLLAEGRTNRQIAEALFLSAKTSRSTCRGSSTSSAPRPAAKPWRSRAGRGSLAARRLTTPGGGTGCDAAYDWRDLCTTKEV